MIVPGRNFGQISGFKHPFVPLYHAPAPVHSAGETQSFLPRDVLTPPYPVTRPFCRFDEASHRIAFDLDGREVWVDRDQVELEKGDLAARGQALFVSLTLRSVRRVKIWYGPPSEIETADKSLRWSVKPLRLAVATGFVMFLFLLAQVSDPVGLFTASSRYSDKVYQQIYYSTIYPAQYAAYLDSENQNQKIGKEDRGPRIRVIELLEEDLRFYDETWPVSYDFHAWVLQSILEQEPAAVFVDIAFIDDRSDANSAYADDMQEVVESYSVNGIPIAIVSDVGSEDELAFVVAHEISHVILNHHNAEWLANTNEKLANVAEVGLASALELGTAYGLFDANNQQDMQKVQQITWFASQATLFLTETALTPSWSRDQEVEADLLAFDLMSRTDYDVYQAPVFLERLLKYFEGVETDPFAARRAELDARAENTRDFGQAFLNFVEKFQLEFDALTTDLEERHPEAQERLDLLVDYIDEHYEDQEDEFDERQADKAGWAKFLAQRSIDELLVIYRASWETRNHIDLEDFKGAQKKAFIAIKGRGGSLALPRLNFARLRMLQGDKTKQRLNLERALKRPEPSFDVYRETIRIYRDSGKIKAADALVDDAWIRFKEPPGLYPFRIDVLLRNNDREGAQKLTTTCRLVFRDKSKSCVKASQGKLTEWEAEQSAGL